MRELIVDNFAGGGGASTGIELATGRSVDIAINHDPAAIAMHKANHPTSKHYCENVWEVDPMEACNGQPVGLAWFSPDCKHFSKAKGGKPVEKKIRGLAWIALKWAGKVRPRVIMLENVEEFVTWGPVRKGQPVKSKKGQTFEKWKRQLEDLGYKVKHRELRACDYGAPTTRKRFFLIARCDGRQIVWPKPTHGDPDGIEVRCGLLQPWKTAAEIIDWSIPCPSIFERKKPLAENTLKRIARGIQKFVIDNPNPFIVQVNHGGENFRGQTITEPMPTLTAKHGFGVVTPVISQIGQTGGGDRLHDIQEPISTIVSKQEHLLVTPYLVVNTTNHPGGSVNRPVHTITTGGHHAVIAPSLIQYHTETTEQPRGQELDKPISTLDGSNRYGLVATFISKYYGGNYEGFGSSVDEPVHTVTSKDHNAVVTTFITQINKSSIGQSMGEPLNTVTAGANHFGEVRTFLTTYYGNGDDIGQKTDEPLRTITSKDRFGLVTIQGQDYQIVDIGMRMLEPHELFKAQGFPEDYIIDHDYTGKAYPKTAQVARCGNAVPPPFAQALVRANLPELCEDNKSQAV